MERLRPYPVATFAALTLFIWGNRIWLAWTNDEDTVAEKLVWSTPITAFVLAAVALAVLLARGTDVTVGGPRRLVQAFAAGTTIYWAVRLPLIWLADHPLGFDVVHSVLAIASVTAAALAWRAVRAPASARSEPAALVRP